METAVEAAQLDKEYREFGMKNKFLTKNVNRLTRTIFSLSRRKEESSAIALELYAYGLWKEMLTSQIFANSWEMEKTKKSYEYKARKPLKTEYGTKLV